MLLYRCIWKAMNVPTEDQWREWMSPASDLHCCPGSDAAKRGMFMRSNMFEEMMWRRVVNLEAAVLRLVDDGKMHAVQPDDLQHEGK